MQNLDALRAAALQTRKSTPESGSAIDLEEGELTGSEVPNRSNNDVPSDKVSIQGTISRTIVSGSGPVGKPVPRPSIGATAAHVETAPSNGHAITSSETNSTMATKEISASVNDYTYDDDIRDRLFNLSAMGVDSEALINFGFHQDAVIRFCKEQNLPLPNFPCNASEPIQKVVESQDTIPGNDEAKNAGDDSITTVDLEEEVPTLTTSRTNDTSNAVKAGNTQGLDFGGTQQQTPSPAALQAGTTLESVIQVDSDSDMDISDVSEPEDAGNTDVEDMDVEEEVGTSTIIMTSTNNAKLEPSTNTSLESSATTVMRTNGTIRDDISNVTASTTAPVPPAQVQRHRRAPLLQTRKMNLSISLSEDSEGETEEAYELFKPVLPEIRSQRQGTTQAEEHEAAALKPQDTDALTARFKQIADMKKMIEQLEQLKKKDKSIASDEESPITVSSEMVTPTPSIASYPAGVTASSTPTPSEELKQMKETTDELVAHAEVVVKAANPEQLSAIMATKDKSVNQLIQSVEQKMQKEQKQTEGEETLVHSTVETSSTNAASSSSLAEAKANSVIETGTKPATVEFPMTAYEEQLKSLQELESEQDEALRAIELKIQEMRKQQEEVMMKKEQAKTKALGVRAKLSMLQRASASPKIRSPNATIEQTQGPSLPLPEKRKSAVTSETRAFDNVWPKKRTKLSSSNSESSQPSMANIILRTTVEDIKNYPINDSYPLFNHIRNMLSNLMARRHSRIPAKQQNAGRILDTLHNHVHIINNIQDVMELIFTTASRQDKVSDTPSSQPDVSINLKDHGRSIDTHTFTQYQTPLSRFRSYQYFGGAHRRSAAYSNPVDTSRNVCAFELAGGSCNDDTCASRHFRDFEMTGKDIIEDLVTYSQDETEDGQAQYQRALKRMFATLDAAKASPATLLRAAANCRLQLPHSERLQKVSFRPSNVRRAEKVNRKRAQPPVKPVSQKLPTTSALKCVLHRSVIIDARYYEVDERNYPRDPKNIRLWIRAFREALPSPTFADYDNSNSKALDMDLAINVLRQALARNPASQLLWCLYVELWFYRGDQKAFEREMQQALRNLPYSLDLQWYQVLAASTVDEQIAISDGLLKHFTSEQTTRIMDGAEISRVVLEILCRQAAILIAHDRHSVAKQLLAGVLSSESPVRAALKLRDQVILAACYFHVCIYERVPSVVFQPHQAQRFLTGKDEDSMVPLFIVIWDEAVATTTFQEILCIIHFERLLEVTLSDVLDADHILFLAVFGNLLEYLKGYPQAASDISSIKNRLEESDLLSSCTKL